MIRRERGASSPEKEGGKGVGLDGGKGGGRGGKQFSRLVKKRREKIVLTIGREERLKGGGRGRKESDWIFRVYGEGRGGEKPVYSNGRRKGGGKREGEGEVSPNGGGGKEGDETLR